MYSLTNKNWVVTFASCVYGYLNDDHLCDAGQLIHEINFGFYSKLPSQISVKVAHISLLVSAYLGTFLVFSMKCPFGQ